jgi:AraC-like DNA-binding protein
MADGEITGSERAGYLDAAEAGPELVPVYDATAFASAPVARCFLGATFVIWCHAPDLVGIHAWGALDTAAALHMARLRQATDRLVARRDRRVLLDFGSVEQTDLSLLLDLLATNTRSLPGWAARGARLVMVVPNGLPGVLLAGTLRMGGAYPAAHVSRDLGHALDVLDHPSARRAHQLAVGIAQSARSSPSLLSSVRMRLAHDLSSVSVASLARELGMSSRTLQRELGLLGTSFRDELRRTRVRVARKLLIASELKVSAISRQVGLANPSRMTEALRRELEMSASEVRATRPLARIENSPF